MSLLLTEHLQVHIKATVDLITVSELKHLNFRKVLLLLKNTLITFDTFASDTNIVVVIELCLLPTFLFTACKSGPPPDY